MTCRLFVSWCAVVVLVVALAGCGQPLHTLQEMGAEKDAQLHLVKAQGVSFKELLHDVDKDALAVGTSRAEIITRYGAPVLENGPVLMYRYPVAFFEGPKIYLELDTSGELENIRIVER